MSEMPLHPDVESIVLSEEDIAEIIERMGAEITRDYIDKNPVVITVLRGALMVTADLSRAVRCPLELDFMAVSSYGKGVKSSGEVRIVKDLDTKIEGRDVLIFEDILDSGLTLRYLMKLLQSRNPKSIRVATFLVKDVPGKIPNVTPAYVGAHVPDCFLVGYGLDYAERYRNLPYIGILKPEVYS